MVASIGVPLSTLYRMTKNENIFKHHTLALLKPKLSDTVMWVADATGTYQFKDLYDRVDVDDVDEKWYHMTCDGEQYIVVNLAHEDSESEIEDGSEDLPTRRTRHKGYIGKV
jgi:hypothetical protein